MAILTVTFLFPIVASCGDERAPSTSGGNLGPVTGLLINAQRPEGMIPIRGTFESWKVVDSSGTPIFSDSDISPDFKQQLGVAWNWKRAVILEETKATGSQLQKNPLELLVMETIISGEEQEAATFTLGDASAAEVRALPNLSELISQCRIAILVGKAGE
jgi:hypothetical protein